MKNSFRTFNDERMGDIVATIVRSSEERGIRVVAQHPHGEISFFMKAKQGITTELLLELLSGLSFEAVIENYLLDVYEAMDDQPQEGCE